MRESPSDIQAIQQGRKAQEPAPSGLLFHTTSWAPVSLYNWFKGRSAFLVLSGPSLRELDLTQLERRGIVTMGVNNSWTMHRPDLWTCVDPPNRFIDTGWKDPGITKFVPAALARQRLGVQKPSGEIVDSAFRVLNMPSTLFFRRADSFDHRRFLTDDAVQWGCLEGDKDPVSIKGKRSVMLVALRLLHHLGFRTVYLLGCDFKMASDRKYAFDEGRTHQAIKHNNALYGALETRFAAMRPHFAEHGFQVLNASPGSELRAFDRIDYLEAVDQAARECGKPVSSSGWYAPRERS